MHIHSKSLGVSEWETNFQQFTEIVFFDNSIPYLSADNCVLFSLFNVPAFWYINCEIARCNCENSVEYLALPL